MVTTKGALATGHHLINDYDDIETSEGFKRFWEMRPPRHGRRGRESLKPPVPVAVERCSDEDVPAAALAPTGGGRFHRGYRRRRAWRLPRVGGEVGGEMRVEGARGCAPGSRPR